MFSENDGDLDERTNLLVTTGIPDGAVFDHLTIAFHDRLEVVLLWMDGKADAGFSFVILVGFKVKGVEG